MVKRDPFAFIEAADDPAAFLARDRDDFIDHDVDVARREPVEG